MEEPAGLTLLQVYTRSLFGQQAMLILLCMIFSRAGGRRLPAEARYYPGIGRTFGLICGVAANAALYYWAITFTYFSREEAIASLWRWPWVPGSIALLLAGILVLAVEGVWRARQIKGAGWMARGCSAASYLCALGVCVIPLRLALGWVMEAL